MSKCCIGVDRGWQRVNNFCVMPLISPHRLSLWVAFVLSTASVASSATLLNIDITPYLDGSQTQISWNLSGDIVSVNGVQVLSPDPAAYSSYPVGSFFLPYNTDPIVSISAAGSGLFSDSFRNIFSETSRSIAYDVISGGSTLTRNDSLLFSSTLTSFKFTVKDTSDIISLGRAISVTGNLSGESIFLWSSLNVMNGDTVKYISSGNDTAIIPIAFSSFNTGIYSNTSNSFADKNDQYSYVFQSDVVTTITVVPEPSTYALFGLGALVLFVAYRRRKLPKAV